MSEIIAVFLCCLPMAGCATKLSPVSQADVRSYNVNKPSYQVDWMSDRALKISVWTAGFSYDALGYVAAFEANKKGYAYFTAEEGSFDGEICVDYCPVYLQKTGTFNLSHDPLNSASQSTQSELELLSKRYAR